MVPGTTEVTPRLKVVDPVRDRNQTVEKSLTYGWRNRLVLAVGNTSMNAKHIRSIMFVHTWKVMGGVRSVRD